MAGVTGASASMTALFAREFTGEGQHVDVSEQETLLRASGNAVVSHMHRGETPSRIAGIGRPIASRKPLLTKDGYFTAQFFADHFWESMKNVLGHPDWMEQELFAERMSRMENLDVILLLVEEWSKDYTPDEVYQILQVGEPHSLPAHNSMQTSSLTLTTWSGRLLWTWSTRKSAGSSHRGRPTVSRERLGTPRFPRRCWDSTTLRSSAADWVTPGKTWQGCDG